MFKLFLMILSMLFSTKSMSSDKSFHDFSIESISGGDISLADYKNKVVLLVNTASQCGFTPQYAGLQKIYDRYKDDGFIVLGVPSDDFKQELSSDDDVKKFCEIRYFHLSLEFFIFFITSDLLVPLEIILAIIGS